LIAIIPLVKDRSSNAASQTPLRISRRRWRNEVHLVISNLLHTNPNLVHVAIGRQLARQDPRRSLRDHGGAGEITKSSIREAKKKRRKEMFNLQDAIRDLIKHLNANADSGENGRAKALTITKLEEALMWSEKI